MPPRCGTLVITVEELVVADEQIGGDGGSEAIPRSVGVEPVTVVPEAVTGDSIVPEAATVDPDWTPGAPAIVDVVTVDVGAGMIPLP
jgi:hypothetical protein